MHHILIYYYELLNGRVEHTRCTKSYFEENEHCAKIGSDLLTPRHYTTTKLASCHMIHNQYRHWIEVIIIEIISYPGLWNCQTLDSNY